MASKTGISPATAEKLAHECGGRRYGAVTRVDDFMLHMGKIPMSVFADNVAHSLAHEIMKNMPDNLMVERKGGGSYHTQGPGCHKYGPFGIPGVTEFRTDVVVFSLESFDKFVEQLLNAYGDHYATAAMMTKKAKLRDTTAKLVLKQQEKRKALEAELTTEVAENVSELFEAIDKA